MGLHPYDVRTLLQVFQKLIDQKATIITITHDLDIMANSDYMIDMGPRGGDKGGQIIASGLPVDISRNKASLTAKYLRAHLELYQK